MHWCVMFWCRRLRTMVRLCSLLVLFTCQANAQSPAESGLKAPHWIWHKAESLPASCRFEKSFALPQAAKRATMRFAADFCTAQIEINGQPVLHVEPYSPTVEVDVAGALRSGQIRVAVQATAVPGPAAVALSLTVSDERGGRSEWITDGSWLATIEGNSAGNAQTFGEVPAELWGLGRRPATIDAFDNYEQWRQATSAEVTESGGFWVAPGFEIARVRAAKSDEGSWVSMAFDPQGRLTIAREDKGLLRMTLSDDRSQVTQVETINSTLEECRGLLYAHGALYANANNSKGLFLLRDRDGDDQFDEVRLLREFRGNVGHGRNDMALGPDNLIYLIHGDAVDLPQTEITDFTSPYREARRGKSSREGHVLRTNAEGTSWELLAGGLRNPFGIAFNARGDLFTYDADAEFDMGSPWYRPTRVVQIVRGGDYGWRGVTGKWPPYFPNHADNAPPALDIGRGSPTAVLFGHQTDFPAEYRQALYILDWAYGRVVAVHLAPRGSGYRAAAETFIKGTPLNVTDIAAGPDGAMYLVTGGRKTQSALYRISKKGTFPRSPSTTCEHELAALKHAEKSRELRLKLEELHRPIGQLAVDEAWPHLSSPDPLIRHAARIAIEHQPTNLWQSRALQEQDLAASLTALLALARSGEQSLAPRLIERLAEFDARRLSLSQSLALLQCYFLCIDELSPQKDAERRQILAQLNRLFPHVYAAWTHVGREGTGLQLNRDLARLLGRLNADGLVPRVRESMLQSSVQEDLLQGLFVLRTVRTGWTPDTRRAYFQALNEASNVVGGEGMPRFLSQIREDAVQTLTEDERQQLADVLAPTQPAEEPLPPPRPLVQEWKLADFATELADRGRLGDRERGSQVFREALCNRCHRAGARGPAVGPDLTSVAGRFSPQDMLLSILEPSKVVAENYRNVQITTRDGRQLVGRLAIEGDFRSEKLRLVTDPLQASAPIELSKRDIEQYREVESSPMPQGLLDSFTKQEILDLLSFLQAPS